MVQPYIKGLRLYVKDPADFILEMNNLERIPKNSILATKDIHSLYINIQNNEDIKAIDNLQMKKQSEKALTLKNSFSTAKTTYKLKSVS